MDLGVQVSVGWLQLLGDPRLMLQRLSRGAPHLRAARTECLQQPGVATGDVDLDPVALQPGGSVGPVGLTGDDLLDRLVGEEGCQGEESRHYGDGESRVTPVVRLAVAIARGSDPVPLLEPLV